MGLITASDSFSYGYTLIVTKTGTGSGSVVSLPAGISCGADCSESYAPGTSVKLTATASAGSAFTGWSGACGGMSTTCYVTMSKAKSVTANFTPNPAGQYFLSTVKVGSGSILSTPAGISCPTDCGEFYNSGTSVKLVATASAGYVFTGWSGACGGTTATCFVPMSKNKTVTATFLAVPAGKYYLGVKKAGMGTVTSVIPGRYHQLRDGLQRVLQCRHGRPVACHTRAGIYIHRLERCLRRYSRLLCQHEQPQVRQGDLRHHRTYAWGGRIRMEIRSCPGCWT